MQKGAHFTIVFTILLIRVGSKIEENFAKQRVYESLIITNSYESE